MKGSPDIHNAKNDLSKRWAAAAWIKMMTDKDIDATDDKAFRLALSDGVLLCHLANYVLPGVIQVN